MGNRLARGVVVWPGDLLFGRRAGLLCWRSSQLPDSGPTARPWGQAGALEALEPVRALARTNELDAGKRRPMIVGEEQSAGYGAGLGGLAGLALRVGFVGRRSGSINSTSAARPAQVDLRARPGLATPSGSVTASPPAGARVLWWRRVDDASSAQLPDGPRPTYDFSQVSDQGSRRPVHRLLRRRVRGGRDQDSRQPTAGAACEDSSPHRLRLPSTALPRLVPTHHQQRPSVCRIWRRHI